MEGTPSYINEEDYGARLDATRKHLAEARLVLSEIEAAGPYRYRDEQLLKWSETVSKQANILWLAQQKAVVHVIGSTVRSLRSKLAYNQQDTEKTVVGRWRPFWHRRFLFRISRNGHDVLYAITDALHLCGHIYTLGGGSRRRYYYRGRSILDLTTGDPVYAEVYDRGVLCTSNNGRFRSRLEMRA